LAKKQCAPARRIPLQNQAKINGHAFGAPVFQATLNLLVLSGSVFTTWLELTLLKIPDKCKMVNADSENENNDFGRIPFSSAYVFRQDFIFSPQEGALVRGTSARPEHDGARQD